MKYFPLIQLIVAIIVSDQLSKYLARVYNLSTLNQGGAFGLWDSKAWIFLTGLLLGFIGFYYFSKQPKGLERIGWIVIFFSGVSNLIDRVIFGGVVDWIYYPFVNLVGNLADIYLGVGVVILLVSEIKAFDKVKYQSEK